MSLQKPGNDHCFSTSQFFYLRTMLQKHVLRILTVQVCVERMRKFMQESMHPCCETHVHRLKTIPGGVCAIASRGHLAADIVSPMGNIPAAGGSLLLWGGGCIGSIAECGGGDDGEFPRWFLYKKKWICFSFGGYLLDHNLDRQFLQVLFFLVRVACGHVVLSMPTSSVPLWALIVFD